MPVEATVMKRIGQWEEWGFRADNVVLAFPSFVDNVFALSNSLGGAVKIMDDFEKYIRSDWNLVIKPTSRSCLVAAGGDDRWLELGLRPLLATACDRLPSSQ